MMLTPVQSALISLLRDSPSCASPEGLTGREWHQLVDASAFHGLASILYRRVKDATVDGIPGPALARLRQHYTRAVVIGMIARRQAEVLSSLFHSHGLDLIFLKGVHLSTTLYDSVPDRPMGDVDLLVRRDQLFAVSEVLANAGYAPSEAYDMGAILEMKHHLPSFVQAGALPVEVHWRLLGPSPPFAISVDGLWARASRYRADAFSFKGLCPEDLLLHLCIHIVAGHRFLTPLRTFGDVRRTVHGHPEIQWEVLVARAREWRVCKHVFYALAVGKLLFDVSIPDDVLTALQPSRFRRESLLALGASILSPAGRLPAGAERVMEAPGWSGKVLELAWMVLRYGERILLRPTSRGRRDPFALLASTLTSREQWKHSRTIAGLRLDEVG